MNLRSSTIVKVEEFPRTKKPAFKVWADFGPEISVSQTSAQVTMHYTPQNLFGRENVEILQYGWLKNNNTKQSKNQSNLTIFTPIKKNKRLKTTLSTT